MKSIFEGSIAGRFQDNSYPYFNHNSFRDNTVKNK